MFWEDIMFTNVLNAYRFIGRLDTDGYFDFAFLASDITLCV